MTERLPTANQSPRELKRQLELERPAARVRRLPGRARAARDCAAPEAPELVIGRGAESELRLSWDPEVSHVHAELQRVGDEWLVIDDGLSRNGTFVGGERVVARRRLRDRDVLRCGRTLILFRNPAAAASEAATRARGADQPQLALVVGSPDRRRGSRVAISPANLSCGRRGGAIRRARP